MVKGKKSKNIMDMTVDILVQFFFLRVLASEPLRGENSVRHPKKFSLLTHFGLMLLGFNPGKQSGGNVFIFLMLIFFHHIK